VPRSFLGRLFRRRPAPPPPVGSPPGEAERLLRRLDFTVVRRLAGLRQGEHRNAAFGFGLDLGELRPYVPGDDVRALDWNVTARMGEAYVRRYHEDRDITAWLLVDLTASTDFGSARQTKRDLVLDVAGTLARLLTARGDRVGALLYTGSTVGSYRRRRRPSYGEVRDAWRRGFAGIESGPERLPAELVTSGAGRVHVLRLLRRALEATRRVPPAGVRRGVRGSLGTDVGYTGTDLAALLEQGFRTAGSRSLVIVLSDFLDEADDAQREWERALGPLARRNEVVGVWVRDPREVALPDVGVVTFQDAESGEQLVVDTSQPSVREAFELLGKARAAEMERRFARHGAALWTISTGEPLVPALVHFLEQRRRTLVGAQRLLRQTA
jgi:uncharacterized protein (DUF58 family)